MNRRERALEIASSCHLPGNEFFDIIERHLREYAEEAVNAMTAQELYDLAVKICLICLSEAAEKYAATIGRVEVVDNADAAKAITGEAAKNSNDKGGGK